MKLCLGCKNPVASDRKYCENCLAKRRQASRDRRQRLKAAGLCISCKEPVGPNHVHCNDCLENIRRANKNRRKRLKAAGLCVQCGQRPAAQGKMLCIKCNERRNSLYMARYRARVEQGVCIDCGGAIDTDTKFCSPCRAKRNLENKNQREKKGNKRAAKDRDGHRCRICGKTTALCIHHIDGQGERNSITKGWQKANDNLDNLITLCRGCHGAITRFINHDSQLASRLILVPQVRQAS